MTDNASQTLPSNNDDEDEHYFEIGSDQKLFAEVTVQNPLWVQLSQLQEYMTQAISVSVVSKHPETLSIVLSDDDNVRVLNRDYRQKDKPTNVLSFPDGDHGHLGDIILAYETVKREAVEQNKEFYHHFVHLLVHGILHLRGYDHENDAAAEEMEKIEINLYLT